MIHKKRLTDTQLQSAHSRAVWKQQELIKKQAINEADAFDIAEIARLEQVIKQMMNEIVRRKL